MQTVRVTTSQNIDIDYDVATLGNRMASRIIDYMIFMCAYFAVFMVFMALSGAFDNYGAQYTARNSTNGIIIMILVWLAMCVFYDLLTEIFLNGQSLGKRALKIRVISLSGTRPSFSQYFLRWVFRILDFGVTFGTAAVITVAFSDKKQRIGDIVAGTAVVKAEPHNKFKDLVFNPPPADYLPTYSQALQLTDSDIVLIHDVIRNFNRTRNNGLIYKLAIRIKQYLGVNYPDTINEYQFLELIVNDYNYLIANAGN